MDAEKLLVQVITALVGTGVLAWVIRLFWKSALGPALAAGGIVAAVALARGQPVGAAAAVVVALALWQSFAKSDAKRTGPARPVAR